MAGDDTQPASQDSSQSASQNSTQPASQEATQPTPPAQPTFAPASLLDLSAVNSGRFMVMRYNRSSTISWPEGFSPDTQVLPPSQRVWLTAGGVCAPLDGPLSALQLMDAVLKLERGEPLDKVYAPDEKDEWSEAQMHARTNDLAGETPWLKYSFGGWFPGGGNTCMISMTAMTGAAIVGLPSPQQCAKCPRRGFCGLALYGRKKGTGEPVYRPLWSGLFCGRCGLGRNLRAAAIESVCSPASTFFTPARGKL
jgi:hypothetical protein